PWTAQKGSIDGGLHRIAAERDSPFFTQKQVRPRRRGQPFRIVAHVESVAKRDAGHLENRRDVAESSEYARAARVVRAQVLSCLVCPVTPRQGVHSRFLP